MAMIAYDPVWGYTLEPVGLNVAERVKPGESTNVRLTYVAVAPDRNTSILCTSFWIAEYEESRVFETGPHEVVVRSGGGIVEETFDLNLPIGRPAGVYQMKVMIEMPEHDMSHTLTRVFLVE